MEMKDKIYFYNPKYPEHGIEELPLVDIKYIKSVIDGRDLYIYSVVSYFDIETYNMEEYAREYHIYNPYDNAEDKDMFMLDLGGTRHRILSFNNEKLENWWKIDLDVAICSVRRRLEELEKCLNQK